MQKIGCMHVCLELNHAVMDEPISMKFGRNIYLICSITIYNLSNTPNKHCKFWIILLFINTLRLFPYEMVQAALCLLFTMAVIWRSLLLRILNLKCVFKSK